MNYIQRIIYGYLYATYLHTNTVFIKLNLKYRHQHQFIVKLRMFSHVLPQINDEWQNNTEGFIAVLFSPTLLWYSKHLELLKPKDEAKSSFIIEQIVGKLLSRTLDLFHFIYPLQDSNGWEFCLNSDQEETKPFELSPKMENLTSPCTVFSLYSYSPLLH